MVNEVERPLPGSKNKSAEENSFPLKNYFNYCRFNGGKLKSVLFGVTVRLKKSLISVSKRMERWRDVTVLHIDKREISANVHRLN